MTSANDDYKWSLILNPTVAGTFTYGDLGAAGESAAQFATGVAANTVTGGLVISSGYGVNGIAIGSREDSSLRIGSTIDGVMDTLVLCVSPLGTNLTCYGSLAFEEFK